MYAQSFGLTEAPFSISPDPRYLFMSERHEEAMAHLRYGIQEAGGFVQLTGEVGTGKTTICRCILEQLPANIDVALVLNPQISHNELLAALCDEIEVAYPADATPKQLLDLLNDRLIEAFSRGRRTVLVIDEAQMLSREVLEQVRILTNLETTTQKLLQIILIGQPELSALLAREDLRQLAQRITARYHLEPLSREETVQYIRYRLGVAGCHRSLFTRRALRRIFRHSKGVPRLVNLLCDRAMLGAYSRERSKVTAAMVSNAAREVFGARRQPRKVWWWFSALAVASVVLVVLVRPQWVGADLSMFKHVEPLSRLGSTTQSAATSAPPVPSPALPQGPETPSKPANPDISITEFLDDTDTAHSENDALVRLLGFWRISASDTGAVTCSTVETVYGLRCLKERGEWEDLQAFNRVAALAIPYHDTVAYPLLTGIGANSVTLANKNRVYNLSRTELERRWQGEFLLLWRAPPRGAETITQHSEGVDVLWLRQTLSRVPSIRSLELDNAYFDASLKEKVMAFQKTNNLRADGVAGAHTIIRLHNIVEPDVPKLEPAAG